MTASKVPRADIDHAIARAFDAESAVVLSVRDISSFASGLAIADSESGRLSPAPALQRIWKRVELEWKACVKHGLQATVRVSFLQLLGSSFRDLLSTSWGSTQISLRDHDTTKSPHISGVDEVTVSSEAEMLECFTCGAKRLETALPGHSGFPEQHHVALGWPAEPTRADDASLSNQDSRESHLIFSFHIHLQGPLTLMPAHYVANLKASKPSGARRKTRGPPKQVDEWIYRSVVRCVDICIPDTPQQSCSPQTSTQMGARESSTEVAPSMNSAHSPLSHAESHAATTPQSTRHQPISPLAPRGGELPCAQCPLAPPGAIQSPLLASTAPVAALGADAELSRIRKDVNTQVSAEAQFAAAGPKEQEQGGNGSEGGSVDAVADGDSPGCDMNRKRVRDDFVFTAPGRLEGDAGRARGPEPRSPHHEVGTLVGLQTSARRLRKSLSSRSPVIMSLVTGAAARAPSVQLPAAGTVQEDQAAAQPLSGVEALEGVLHARQQQKAMLPFRAHLLSRILRPAVNGTAHCVMLPVASHAADLSAPSGEVLQSAHRAAALREFFTALQAHSPRRDTARLDAQSDVVKWMQLENRSLKSELVTAREKAGMLQRFVASHGAQEVKTWELWQELETVRASATALRAEADTLQAELHSARSTAAAAEAAAEVAGERAAAEASMRVGACREAASAAARAAAMEAAADRMARQLADSSGLGLHLMGIGAGEPCGGRAAHMRGHSSANAAGDGVFDAGRREGVQQAVSVQLTVAEGKVHVGIQPAGKLQGTSAEDGPMPMRPQTPPHALNGTAAMAALCTGSQTSPNGLDTGLPRDPTRASRLSDAARTIDATLSASLEAAAQQHKLRCEQAQRAAVDVGNSNAAQSSVLSLLALLVRALVPHTAPSIASAGAQPHSDAGVTPSASAGSLEIPLSCQRVDTSRPHSHAAAQSLVSASEASPRPSDSAHSEAAASAVTPIQQGRLAAQSSGNLSALDALPGDPRCAAEPLSAPVGTGGPAVAADRWAVPDQRELEGVRTAWPADLAVAPDEWVSALVAVLQLPRELEGQISALASQGEDVALERQHLQVQQQQAMAVQSALLTPFKVPSARTLYTLWGWLRPPATGPRAIPSPTPADAGVCTAQLQQSQSAEEQYSMAVGKDAGLRDSRAPETSNSGLLGYEMEPWWALAGGLHDVLCALGRQQTQLVQVTRDQQQSEVCMLQDNVKAYQVSNKEHARLHNEAALRVESMRAQCEDAVACARVFDETVANLVAAKMAHASADAALRAMRDQVEALSAQVPLAAGQSTQHASNSGGAGASREGLLASMRGWGRRSRGSGELPEPVAPTPDAQDAQLPRQEGLLPGAVSRSAAIAKSALSGISAYFTAKPLPAVGDSSPQARW